MCVEILRSLPDELWQATSLWVNKWSFCDVTGLWFSTKVKDCDLIGRSSLTDICVTKTSGLKLFEAYFFLTVGIIFFKFKGER